MRRLGATFVPALLLALALPLTGLSPALGQGDDWLRADQAGTDNPFTRAWTETRIDADQNFRGLAAVSRREAWVSGESLNDGPARVFRTTNRGKTWLDVTPPRTKGLSLRDVEVKRGVAHVLAIGPGKDSRIYRSTNGGRSWTVAFLNKDKDAFYDCMAFFGNGRRGLAVSDPVDGKFRILSTRNRGKTWSVLSSKGMPDTTGEGAFAASGDCLTTAGRAAFLITGGAQSRVLRSSDYGLTWTAIESGIPAGEAAGGFAGTFATPRHGIVVGGDFADAKDNTESVAITRDGQTWALGADLTHIGEDVTMLRGWKVAVATGDYDGSKGSSLTSDGGVTWERVSNLGYHSIDCVAKVCWAAGSKGKVGHN